MCGLADDNLGPACWDVITRLFGPLDWGGHPRRDEVRPTDQLQFVRHTEEGYSAATGRLGLVPSGMSLEQVKRYATFNARIEGLEDKPLFRDSFRQRLCVIPLAGFWEWPVWHGVKTRVRISRRESKPLLVAGLWSRTKTPQGPLESCTIVTRPPTADLLEVHDRMRALLLARDLEAWRSATCTREGRPEHRDQRRHGGLGEDGVFAVALRVDDDRRISAEDRSGADPHARILSAVGLALCRVRTYTMTFTG